MIYSIEEKINNIVTNVLNPIHRHRVLNIGMPYIKPLPTKIKFTENNNCELSFGWDVLKLENVQEGLINDKLVIPQNTKGYKFKGNEVKISYIIDQIKYDDSINAIKKNSYDGLLNECLIWKSILIIDKLYLRHKLKKRKWDHFTVGNKTCQVRSKVMIIDKQSEYYNKKAKIIARSEDSKTFTLSVETDLQTLTLNDISRNQISPFIEKDGKSIIISIYKYRKYYKNVVREIKSLQHRSSRG